MTFPTALYEQTKYIIQFYEENGCIPLESKYPPVKKLKEKYRQDYLHPKLEELIDNSCMPKEVLGKVSKTEEQHAKFILDFYKQHNKLPGVKENSQIPLILGKYRKGTLGKKATNHLDSIPSVDIKDKRTMTSKYDHCKNIVKFFKKNKRLPYNSEYPAFTAIKKLYRENTLDDKCRKYLDKHNIVIDEYIPADSNAYGTHTMYIIKFYEENGRVPTEVEFKPINKIREKYRNGTLYKNCIKLIEESNMPIHVFDRKFKTSKEHAKEIIKFYKTHKRVPVRREYNYINKLRGRFKHKSLPKDVHKLVEDNIPYDHLFCYKQLTQLDHVKHVIDYYNTNAKLPPESEYSHVKTLKRHYRENTLSPDSIEYFTSNNIPVDILKTNNKDGITHFRELTRIYEELLELGDEDGIKVLQAQVNSVYEINLEDLIDIKKRKPLGYWNLGNCKADALKYKNKRDWRKFGGSGYATAKRKGWIDECCKHMLELQQSWTKDQIKEEALRYATIKEWKEKSYKSYDRAKYYGITKECSTHMERKEWNKYTNDEIYENAKKYNSFTDWYKNNKSITDTARKRGIIENCKKLFDK